MDSATSPKPGQLYRLAWGFYLLLATAGVIWIGVREGRISLTLFFNPLTWWLDLAVGLAAAGVLFAVWEVARRSLARARELESHLRQAVGAITGGEVLALSGLSGFTEELFFRGAVQGSWGWLWASVLFALVHSGPGRAFRLWSLYAGLAGMLLGGLVLWRGNLASPILAHALFNAVNLYRLSQSMEEPLHSPEGKP